MILLSFSLFPKLILSIHHPNSYVVEEQNQFSLVQAMMWGRRRSSKSSSSKAALIPSVFPISWLSKLKQRNDKSSAAGSGKEKGRWNAEPTRIAEKQGSWRNIRLHGGDEEGSWRLSFRDEESVDGRKSGCYDSGYGHVHGVLPNSCKEEVAEEVGQGEMEGLGEMVLNLRKMKEMNMFDAENLADCDTRKDRQQTKGRAPRRDRKDGEILKKTDEKVMEDKLTDFARRFHEGKRVQTIKRSNRHPAPSSPAKSRQQASISSGYSSLRTIEEDDGSAVDKSSSEWQSLKDIKMKELMSKSETHRKSIYVSRELQSKRTKSGKVRVYSPRTPLKVDICKIKALEDMKKARKMKTKEMAAKERAVLDSFAVLKCSFDPQKDFRESMLEMIMEKGLRQPEQLEELLTCYLTLNSDEYHDLIIDVFRQVWFDLNSNDLEAESQGKCNYYA